MRGEDVAAQLERVDWNLWIFTAFVLFVAALATLGFLVVRPSTRWTFGAARLGIMLIAATELATLLLVPLAHYLTVLDSFQQFGADSMAMVAVFHQAPAMCLLCAAVITVNLVLFESQQ